MLPRLRLLLAITLLIAIGGHPLVHGEPASSLARHASQIDCAGLHGAATVELADAGVLAPQLLSSQRPLAEPALAPALPASERFGRAPPSVMSNS